jgi:hypothetical protein
VLSLLYSGNCPSLQIVPLFIIYNFKIEKQFQDVRTGILPVKVEVKTMLGILKGKFYFCLSFPKVYKSNLSIENKAILSHTLDIRQKHFKIF